MKIICYQKAKDFMLQGHRVLEVPQFRGANIPYVQDQYGNLHSRIRSDQWDKLRLECRMIEKQCHGKRGQHVNYLWAYGEIKSWLCTYQHPTTDQIVKTIVHAVNYEEAETKGWKENQGWTLIKVEELRDDG